MGGGTSSNAISETTKISFGSSGNYTSISKLDLANITVSDNGGNNSQVKNGYLTFDVLSGASVTINSYSGYTSYTLGDGTNTTEILTGTTYTYKATSDCTITITPQSSNNYFYSIVITYPISVNTTISFGSSGNYASVANIDLSNITVADNGGDNSQVKNGYLTFNVLSGATVTINGYPNYTSYTLGDGTSTTDTITDKTYQYFAQSDCTVTITPVNSNYFYSIVVAY